MVRYIAQLGGTDSGIAEVHISNLYVMFDDSGFKVVAKENAVSIHGGEHYVV